MALEALSHLTRFRVGNPCRGYFQITATSIREAWEKGRIIFNRKFPMARGRGLILYQYRLIKAKETEDWQLARWSGEFIPIIISRSTLPWEKVSWQMN
jgi:hypothetical protein